MTGGTTNSNGTNAKVQSRAGTHNNLLNFKLVVPSATWMSTSIAAVRSNIHWDATYRVGHRMIGQKLKSWIWFDCKIWRSSIPAASPI